MMYTSTQVASLPLEELPWLTADDIEVIRDLDLQERGAVLAAGGRTVAGVAKEARFLDALEDANGAGKQKEKSRAEEALHATASRAPAAFSRSRSPTSPPLQSAGNLGSLGSMRRTESSYGGGGGRNAALLTAVGSNDDIVMKRLMSVVSSNSDGGASTGGDHAMLLAAGGGQNLTAWERHQFTSGNSLTGGSNSQQRAQGGGGAIVIEPRGASRSAARDLFQFSPDPLQRIKNVRNRMGDNSGPLMHNAGAAAGASTALVGRSGAVTVARPTTVARLDELTFDGIDLDFVDLDNDL